MAKDETPNTDPAGSEPSDSNENYPQLQDCICAHEMERHSESGGCEECSCPGRKVVSESEWDPRLHENEGDV